MVNAFRRFLQTLREVGPLLRSESSHFSKRRRWPQFF